MTAAFAGNGQRLVTASHDRSARVWDLDGTELALLHASQEGVVESAAFNGDGRLVVTGSEDRKVRVFDVETQQQLALLDHHEPLIDAQFAPDGRRILVTGARSVSSWEWGEGGGVVGLPTHPNVVAAAAFHPDGTRVATACHDGRVRLWQARDGFLETELPDLGVALRGLAWIDDGKRLLTFGPSNVWSYDLSTEMPTERLSTTSDDQSSELLQLLHRNQQVWVLDENGVRRAVKASAGAGSTLEKPQGLQPPITLAAGSAAFLVTVDARRHVDRHQLG